MRSVEPRRPVAAVTPPPAVRAPSVGSHAQLLRLAAAVGNQRMAQIAREPESWGQWYGPPMGSSNAAPATDLDADFDDDDGEAENATPSAGPDLGFLDEDDDMIVTAALPPDGEAIVDHGPPLWPPPDDLAVATDAPPLGPQQATVTDTPGRPTGPQFAAPQLIDSIVSPLPGPQPATVTNTPGRPTGPQIANPDLAGSFASVLPGPQQATVTNTPGRPTGPQIANPDLAGSFASALPEPQQATVTNTPGRPTGPQIVNPDLAGSFLPELPGPQQATITNTPGGPLLGVRQRPAPELLGSKPKPARDPATELAPLKGQKDVSKLTRKVDELMRLKLVDVAVSGVYTLGNPYTGETSGSSITLERKVTVTSKASGLEVAKFVVHYHPGAQKASAKAGAYSSDMHVKTFSNSAKAYRDTVSHESHPELNKVIPKAGPSMQNWQQAPINWGQVQEPKKPKPPKTPEAEQTPPGPNPGQTSRGGRPPGPNSRGGRPPGPNSRGGRPGQSNQKK
jgi:hypothetical protein